MKLLRLFVVAAMPALVLGIGCSQKKPKLVAPLQQPITAAPEPAPTPEPTPTPQPVEQTQATQPDKPADQTAAKPKPKTVKRPVAKKPAQPAPATSEKPATTEIAKNTVPKVRVGLDKEPAPLTTSGQIAPAPSPSDNTQSQAATEQLLQLAETNLNNLKRQLTKEEEAIRTQIREFIDQSRKAVQEKDMLRAHNLAVKARLLSDDLVKQP